MRFWLTSPRASSLFLFFALALQVSAADTPTTDDPDTPENHDPPCTVTSPHSGNFFDLRPLIRIPGKTPSHTDWLAKGLDYNSNFTINICAPVLADTSDVAGINGDARKNISAFYDKDGERFSIGFVFGMPLQCLRLRTDARRGVSTNPHFRGRKLVIEYTDGSPCPDAPKHRKSTLMSLMCDREMFQKASISFVGQANDCAYFFEVRTASACPTFKAQTLGPISVFGIM